MEPNSGGGWAAGGWISGSCTAPGTTVYVPHARPALYFDEPSTAWLSGDHQPARPSWQCRQCDRPWPCGPAQELLAVALSPRWLSTMMSEWMYLAASELGQVEPGQLFDRFLLWTRRR
jgi:hypothetical protein